ncbi:MAG: FAD-dependent oxidoreductase [Salinirussus sp.]
MRRDPTVLVVGGGATGAGVARDLALRGVDTALAERGGLAGGTTGRSHGLLHSGVRYVESDLAGATECIEENHVLRRIAGECVRETGGLFVQLAGDDPAYFEEKRTACEAAGIDVSTVDGDAARERVPGLSADVERALQVPDAVVLPSRLVAATAADAEANGATVHTDTPLEGLSVRDGRVTAARVGGSVDGRIEPEVVVNAAGAWAGEVAAMAGVSVEMSPTRGVMVSVEYDGVGMVLNRCRPPDDGDIVVPHEREAVLGTTSVPVSDPDSYERADWEIERSVAECAAMVPAVADAAVVRTWWGVRPLYAREDADSRGISRGFARLDHAAEGVGNLISIVGGKLTTYRRMAAATADLVCERLGVEAGASTADRRLPGADDPQQLDEYVRAYDGQGPTDADLVGG